MLYLERKIDTFLIHWKETKNKSPLIVKGARQVGKTESILRFARQQYASVIYINFVEEPKYKTITENGYSAKEIIKMISLLDPSKRFIPGNTVIIFDELQEFPDIATSLKFFKIDNRFDVICSGSMLGIQYKKIESNSVGYKTDYEMHSLDFEEFLWARGYDHSIRTTLLNHMVTQTPFSPGILSTFFSLFMDFCILGGMPAVVRDYIANQTFEGSLNTQRQLLADYREDVRKYASGVDQTRILNVFEHIHVQLAKDNKKFQYKVVQKGGSAPIMDVIGYGDAVTTKGLNMLYGPGNDLVSATALTAAGAHMILFSTRRGTPFGAPAPTLKIATNSQLAAKKSTWIDFNAGVVADGEKTLDEAGADLYQLVLDVASGKQTCAEKKGFREISIFKDGVVL